MIIQLTRRRFLAGCGALGAATAVPGLSLMHAAAQTATDYKALVCVFLYGGNDGNNTVIPIQAAEYGAYNAVRGSLAIPQANVAPLPDAVGTRFGLHPGLAPLVQVWNAGKLAIQFNVGPLLQPITRAEYRANRSLRPNNLFSHDDQQHQWQSAIYNQEARSGWGGRMAERLAPLNGGAGVPLGLSLNGNDVFLAGDSTSPFSIPSNGTFGLQGFGTGAAEQAKYTAMQTLWNNAMAGTPRVTKAAAEQVSRSVLGSQTLSTLSNAANAMVESLFAGQNSGVARQLLRAAKIIAGRDQLAGVRRQIFFVGQGGYDTHGDQIANHGARLGELGPALKSFYDATVQLGVASQVTTFTFSDFGRTFKPNNSGTDHAWGNHHVVMGGAVRGGQTYGMYPTLALGGPDDTDSEGRWIPTTGTDQFGATLALWFGVQPADLALLFPNIARFPATNLGFMT